MAAQSDSDYDKGSDDEYKKKKRNFMKLNVIKRNLLI